jgi:thiaminase
MQQMNIKLSYDKDSDTLYIDWCETYPEQDSKTIAQGVLARVNPTTNAVESLEVLDFESRFRAEGMLELPIIGTLQLAS